MDKLQGPQMAKCDPGLRMGVLIPISPAYAKQGCRFFPFEESWYWGEWEQSPLLYEDESSIFLQMSQSAKLRGNALGAAHQPLNLHYTRLLKERKSICDWLRGDG